MILLKNGSIVLNNKLVKKDILIDNDLIIKREWMYAKWFAKIEP